MGMWAEPDPNHQPKYHTFGEDVRDLGKLCWRVIKWPLAIIVALAALLLFAAAVLSDAVPDWVWWWIAGVCIWKVFMDTIRGIVREEIERAKKDS